LGNILKSPIPLDTPKKVRKILGNSKRIFVSLIDKLITGFLDRIFIQWTASWNFLQHVCNKVWNRVTSKEVLENNSVRPNMAFRWVKVQTPALPGNL